MTEAEEKEVEAEVAKEKEEQKNSEGYKSSYEAPGHQLE